MLKTSIPNVLIPAWQQALRSRKRRGSVACTGKGRGSGITRSKPSVRVSHIRLKVSFLEDKTQWGTILPRCHTVIKVASLFVHCNVALVRCNQLNRRASNEEVNGVESQPNYDAASQNINMGSPKLGMVFTPAQYGDGVPIVPNGWSVMDSAVGSNVGRTIVNKRAVMRVNAHPVWGKWNSFFVQSKARKEDC